MEFQPVWSGPLAPFHFLKVLFKTGVLTLGFVKTRHISTLCPSSLCSLKVLAWLLQLPFAVVYSIIFGRVLSSSGLCAQKGLLFGYKGTNWKKETHFQQSINVGHAFLRSEQNILIVTFLKGLFCFQQVHETLDIEESNCYGLL